jgi:hypothetical protein
MAMHGLPILKWEGKFLLRPLWPELKAYNGTNFTPRPSIVFDRRARRSSKYSRTGCSGRFSNCMYANAAALLQRQFLKLHTNALQSLKLTFSGTARGGNN